MNRMGRPVHILWHMSAQAQTLDPSISSAVSWHVDLVACTACCICLLNFCFLLDHGPTNCVALPKEGRKSHSGTMSLQKCHAQLCKRNVKKLHTPLRYSSQPFFPLASTDSVTGEC